MGMREFLPAAADQVGRDGGRPVLQTIINFVNFMLYRWFDA